MKIRINKRKWSRTLNKTPIRVTEVLDFFAPPWLVDWKLRVGKAEANRISKAAMKIGSRVDELIKRSPMTGLVMEKSVADKEEVKNCMVAYKKWLEVYKPKAITPCTRLYATIEGIEVTGEPDLDIDECITDLKCASKISISHKIQDNVYEFIRRQLKLKPYPEVAILRLDKITGSFEYFREPYNQNLVDCWRGLLKAYVYYNGGVHDGVEV